MTTPTSGSASLIGSEAWRLCTIERLALAVSAVTRRHRRPAKRKTAGGCNPPAVSEIKPQSRIRKGIDREIIPN